MNMLCVWHIIMKLYHTLHRARHMPECIIRLCQLQHTHTQTLFNIHSFDHSCLIVYAKFYFDDVHCAHIDFIDVKRKTVKHSTQMPKHHQTNKIKLCRHKSKQFCSHLNSFLSSSNCTVYTN